MPLPDNYRPFVEAYPVLSLIGNTPLFRVKVRGMPDNGSEIWAKAEWTNPGGSIKDRPVMRMLLEAALQGLIRPGQSIRHDNSRMILDSSSGNAGIAYAMIGRALGVPVELVVPGNASLERKKRIRAHGATLIETNPLEGYDAALHEAHRRYQADPDRYYLPDQYANENNWRAHFESTAPEIIEQTKGVITHFVAGIGTGGTITGVGRRLKAYKHAIEIICVRPDAFPGIEGLKPLETPKDIVPKILDRSVIDREISVSIDDAYEYCHRLAHSGIFVGQSAGAYLKAAIDIAHENPGARIVTVFSDIGERYFSTRLWDS